MADMDSAKLLEEIEIYIDNCKTAGVLSSGNMIKVNREELIAMLEEVRMRLPKEIAELKKIVNDAGLGIAGIESVNVSDDIKTANHAGCGKRSRCDD